MNVSEKLKKLESYGYYLCYMEDGTWCFGNEYLSDDDDDLFLLMGINGTDKNVVIIKGFDNFKKKVGDV